MSLAFLALSAHAVEVPLTLDPSFGDVSSQGMSLETVQKRKDPLHADARSDARFVVTRLGDENCPFEFSVKDGAWQVRADLDRSGAIDQENETISLTQDGNAASTEVTIPIARPNGIVQTPYRLHTTIEDDTRTYLVDWQSKRTGTLPSGQAFVLHGVGGAFDTSATKMILDEDGDGTPDEDNFLARYRGVVSGPDGALQVTIAGDGTSLTLSETTEEITGFRVGSAAPDFSVNTTEGETKTLADYRGERLLLEFWATWCPPCIALHPDMKELVAANPSLQVLGISADDNPQVLKKWLSTHPLPWPSAAIGMNGATNMDYEVLSRGWPTFALIDAEGRLEVMGDLSAVERALAVSTSGAASGPQ